MHVSGTHPLDAARGLEEVISSRAPHRAEATTERLEGKLSRGTQRPTRGDMGAVCSTRSTHIPIGPLFVLLNGASPVLRGPWP